jgi:hypothetical protein
MQNSSCPSALASLNAARFILDTVRSLLATTIDFSLLVHTTAVSGLVQTSSMALMTHALSLKLYWCKAASVFIRFYGDALERGEMRQASAYKSEAETMKCVSSSLLRGMSNNDIVLWRRLAVARMGERLAVADSLAKTIQEWIDSASSIASRVWVLLDDVCYSHAFVLTQMEFHSAPSVDNVWMYLRYSERRRVGLHPAYLGAFLFTVTCTSF